MSMVVQHNITAMNANRMLGQTSSAQAKSTEKLSSGYRINRAADDAAGLSISEKMRKQIKGLDKASSNAQDGISAVQTAEGALTEVHSMLQRMNELATQASNGTNSETDRASLQAEIEQLTTEIDRVAETTKFNETYLLKGNAEGAKSMQTVKAHDAGIEGKLVDNGDGTSTFAAKELADGDTVKIAGRQYKIGNNTSDLTKTNYAKTDALDSKAMNIGDSIYDSDEDKTYTIVGKVANDASTIYVNDKTTFTITSANGEEVKYAVKASEDHTGAVDNVTATNAQAIIADALKAGSTVTMTADGAGKAVNYQIVESLDDGAVSGHKEISAVNKTDGTTKAWTVTDAIGAGGFNTGAITLAEQDKITLSGEETVLTDSNPASRESINNIIDVLNNGDKVSVKSRDAAGNAINTARVFTIADKTNEAAGEYTAADLKNAIGNFDEVQFNTAATNAKGMALIKALEGNSGYAGGVDSTAVTLTPDQAVSTDSDVLSKSQAYDKMAAEIQKASSIGADEGKEATVTHDGKGNFTITQGQVEVTNKLNFNLHVGADADMTNKIMVDIESMGAANLGIKGLNIQDDTGVSATYAIDAIQDAIEKVSSQRSALGAVQNRLEHTIANLDNVVENTTSAESSIRDTDMASEMVNFSKNNILAQAGQSMLAQANQANQGVLSLLG